ncbi:MAG TPA: DNA replication/repair protein RecF [Flavilitoribacter sp.]|nr:DNA replication/repair protein RecF [Flavilitoribacter sp.]
MFLDHLKLTNFKNYRSAELAFHDQINCFTGKNGMGKTNLLDAVYYLCMGKSYFSNSDQHLPLHGEDFFRLEGRFSRLEKWEKIVAKVQPRKKKELERNDTAYNRISEHVGLIPVVIAAPDDAVIVSEGSESRRRFLDNTLSQLDQAYLRNLIQYNQTLQQRNAALKQMAESRSADHRLLDIYDQQLLGPGMEIFNARKAFLAEFSLEMAQVYQTIAAAQETVNCAYQSPLEKEEFAVLLGRSRERDLILGRTSTGVHRDDMVFNMDDRPLKLFGSQGQTKTFVLALKFAQFSLLKGKKSTPPILLLDDIFAKLDQDRINHLLTYLLNGEFGQFFITDTDENRVAALIGGLGAECRQFRIMEGAAEVI